MDETAWDDMRCFALAVNIKLKPGGMGNTILIRLMLSVKRTVDDFGKMYAYTYRQLVRRAEKRLFNLKEKLTVRYQEMSVKDYLSEVLKEPRQTELAMAK